MRKLIIVLMIGVLAFAAGCRTHSASSYSRNEMGRASFVDSGTVLSVRIVDIEGTNSGIGTATGAAAGAVAGSYIGGDVRSNILGAIGGAVVGGAVGYVAEEAITSGQAFEVTVRNDNGQVFAVVQDSNENLMPGDRVLVMDNGQSVRVVRDTQGVGNQGTTTGGPTYYDQNTAPPPPAGY